MHTKSIKRWSHDHTFGQDVRKFGERRTLIVITVTALTMAIEIAAGIAYGSMALLADGLHMGSHASALTISAFAYYYTRRHARDTRFSFGTGKVNTLAAFASGVVLVLFALVMAGESIQRFVSPVAIQFDQAILVAIVGLVVNGVCLIILGGHGNSGKRLNRDHADRHTHGHAHGVHLHSHGDSVRKDHNLWSAYLHVLADALTSLLAIFALLSGKYFGLQWLDPVMGIVGAILVVRWSWTLLRHASRVLLDMQAPDELRHEIRGAFESQGDTRVSDLHVWAVGPEIYAAEITVISSDPLETDGYRKLLPENCGIVHLTVETRRCPSAGTDTR